MFRRRIDTIRTFSPIRIEFPEVDSSVQPILLVQPVLSAGELPTRSVPGRSTLEVRRQEHEYGWSHYSERSNRAGILKSTRVARTGRRNRVEQRPDSIRPKRIEPAEQSSRHDVSGRT